MRYKSKLKNGLIPEGEKCPFDDRCFTRPETCSHGPFENDFSCGLARFFDMCDKAEHDQREQDKQLKLKLNLN